MRSTLVSALSGLAWFAACAASVAAPVDARDGVLANASGMTLYVFDKDVAGAGKSVCNGDCAAKWPPLAAAAADSAHGDYGIIVRDDGSRQWTYKGKPLYLWFKDKQPGDKTGDGVNNVWHAARP
jgi:predicted lipoprotein with Yx(FWY)xxD motif